MAKGKGYKWLRQGDNPLPKLKKVVPTTTDSSDTGSDLDLETNSLQTSRKNTPYIQVEKSQSENEPSQTTTPHKQPKIPPFIIHLDDWPKAAKLIVPEIPEILFNGILVNGSIHLRTSNIPTFHKTQNLLENNTIPSIYSPSLKIAY